MIDIPTHRRVYRLSEPRFQSLIPQHALEPALQRDQPWIQRPPRPSFGMQVSLTLPETVWYSSIRVPSWSSGLRSKLSAMVAGIGISGSSTEHSVFTNASVSTILPVSPLILSLTRAGCLSLKLTRYLCVCGALDQVSYSLAIIAHVVKHIFHAIYQDFTPLRRTLASLKKTTR